eukprot:TRINITY_DN6443_c0_g1_i2.p2 TRINITY_DN6443_c0_g1~~TRINITY_DN6443_c0_g1_i2.p2  ORF type:complete len:114 (+),score=21.93 TRINITY_DN6443_c0_g1_i2:613-954(+)
MIFGNLGSTDIIMKLNFKRIPCFVDQINQMRGGLPSGFTYYEYIFKIEKFTIDLGPDNAIEVPVTEFFKNPYYATFEFSEKRRLEKDDSFLDSIQKVEDLPENMIPKIKPVEK